MRNVRALPVQPLLQPVSELPESPLGRVVMSGGVVSYRAVPVHAYPDGTARGVQTAPGFGSLYRAGRA